MWSGYLLYLPWRCRASQFWWEISVIFLSQAWQAVNTLRLLRNLSIRALTSFSGFSSSVGPCTDFNYLLASLKIVVGVVAKWVLPLKYLTFRFWNSYVVPFLPYWWTHPKCELRLYLCCLLTHTILFDERDLFCGFHFNWLRFFSTYWNGCCHMSHDFLVYLWSWYLSQNDRDSGLHWKGE